MQYPMTIIDSVFVAMFARYRRRPAHTLDSAWRAAEYQLGSHLVVTLAVLGVSLFLVASPSHRAVTSEQRQLVIVVIIALGLLLAFALNRRFHKFLTSPPPLEPTESVTNTRLIRVFRLLSLGVCATGFAFAYFLGYSAHN